MATVVKYTHAGKASTTAAVIGSGTPPAYGGWGTGASAATEAATTLSTESPDESRAAVTLTQVTTTQTDDTVQGVFTITCATNDKTITNMAQFDAAAVGNMFVLASFTGVALVVGERIEATFKVKYSM